MILCGEPEANINPLTIPILVDILLELQKEVVQVFLVTYSYNLAKYFEIKREIKMLKIFYSLYKT